MQIDWLTVAAQAVNFMVLVYLLRRFLYRPVMEAMARREARIAQQLQEAGAREQKAEEAQQQYRDKVQAIEREKEAMLAAAAKDAEEMRKHLHEEARRDVDEIRTVWKKDVDREQQEFLRQFKPQVADAMIRATRRMLSDMADSGLEQQLIRTFIKQLEEPDHDTLAVFRKNAHKSATFRVTTSFEPDADTRSRIKRAVQHHLLEGAEVEIQFHHSAALLCGIELSTEGRKLGWTLENYLQRLELELAQAFASSGANEESGRA